MHSRGDPESMLNDENCRYAEVVEEVAEELNLQLATATQEGIPRWHQYVDPGIGFAKRADENMLLLAPHNLQRLKERVGSRPVMVGVSRKRFLNRFINEPTDVSGKDAATMGASCVALSGGASLLRVHRVKEMRIAADVYCSLLSGSPV